MIDLEIKKKADDWADKVYFDICVAANDPTVVLSEEEKIIYSELKEWGWFELCPVGENDINEHAEQITKMHLAFRKYAKLKWQKDHPAKPQLSKWEKVVGKSRSQPPKKR